MTARSALLLGLLCSPIMLTAQPAPVARFSAAERAAVLDTIAATLRSLYVLPEAGAAMATALERERTRGAFDTMAEPSELLSAVTQLVRQSHRDTHLRFRFDPEEAARMNDTSTRVDDRRDARDRRENYQFHAARILPGNIGYVAFHQFADTSADARRTVRAAMHFVANADALILDLRDNRGGSAAMAGEISGYFVRDSVHWFRSYNRLRDRWTDEWTRNNRDVTGGVVLSMPVTVLTSAWTFSAGEALAYALQHGRGARVVGESTAGGAHVIRRVSLGHGVIGFIPYIRGVHVATQANWEGTGVTPDVRVPAADALLRAREDILSTRLAGAPDSAVRQAARFALRAARAEERLLSLPASALRAFAGVFGEYTFSIRGADLFAANAYRNGREDRLIPITPTLFQIDRQSQVEFLAAKSGRVAAIRILWDDGWIDTVERSRRRKR
jgi:retinol-binding protein 3